MVWIPYWESVADKLERMDWPVIWLENGKNYIEFSKYMELEKERNNYKTLSEEREENCWALAKVIDEQEKKIKKLNEEIDELKQRVEDSDRWEDYRWERCNEAERKLLKIKCFLNE